MDKPTRTALILAGAVTGVSLLAAGLLALTSKQPTPTSAPKKVALIGDSLAVGLGPLLANLYAPIPFQFEGHISTTPAQWATHAAACGQCGDWLAAFQPTTTLVVLGTNDLYSVPNPTYYQTIRDKILALGSQVAWVEPPISITKGTTLAQVRQVIESLGVQVIPAANVPVGPDGVHPTGAGYAQLASIIRSAT